MVDADAMIESDSVAVRTLDPSESDGDEVIVGLRLETDAVHDSDAEELCDRDSVRIELVG